MIVSYLDDTFHKVFLGDGILAFDNLFQHIWQYSLELNCQKKKHHQYTVYNETSRKRPPLMSGLSGHLWKVVAYGTFH